jgi:NACalpha-BTF3-like transcription factor
MVSSKAHSRQVEMRANHQSMDKVMKRLGIEVVELGGKDVESIVHCNSKGKLVGGGRIVGVFHFKAMP